MDREVLAGGVANAGAVVRVGDVVVRPASVHSPSIHALLGHLHAKGFTGAPEPVAVADGRERLRFVPGDVAVPPFPDWAQSDAALASAAELLRAYHEAVADFVRPSGSTWSDELADPMGGPVGGPILCHNDVCFENVVFRRSRAVCLLDFDFVAPGRALYDLACFARMCVPVDDPASAARSGWRTVDVGRRLRLVADAYGLAPDRSDLLAILADTIAAGGGFMARRVEQGDANFTRSWQAMGGMARFDRRRRWFADHRAALAAALG